MPKHYRYFRLLSLATFLLLATTNTAFAQSSGFTYQGALSDGGTLANGNYALQFSLWDSASGGTQIGSTQTLSVVPVSNGVFSVTLDFGASAFSGGARFLEISTRPTGVADFTLLSPRQQITSTPYAVRSLNAAAADALSAVCNGCVNDGKIGGIAGSKINGTVPVASVPAGSSNYVQNTTSQQASSNFNISGNGTADTFNATTQYSIGGARILTNAGNQNLFAGTNAGIANSTGQGDSFFGAAAGAANTSGTNNSFFGGGSGKNTTSGGNNSFFGYFAGAANTTGTLNSFYGTSTGVANTTGSSNSFFGAANGTANTTGSFNSFFGRESGASNTSGNNNAFYGYRSGKSSLSANDNSFFGYQAGFTNTANGNSFFGSSAGTLNTTGDENAFFGHLAGSANNTGTGNSFFGHSSGLANTTGQVNSFFGENSGKANTTGSANAYFGAGAGFSATTGFLNSFFGVEAGYFTTGGYNTFIGGESGFNNTTGISNTFVGEEAGGANTTGNDNAFFGSLAGSVNQTGSNNTSLGAKAGGLMFDLINATAVGARAGVAQSNSLVLGSITGINGATADTKVGIGTTTPSERLTIKTGTSSYGFIHTDGTITVGSFVGGSANGGYLGTKSNHSLNFFVNDGAPSLSVDTGGIVHVNTLGAAGATALCRNASNQISTCSSSLRYKKDLQPFTRGLSLLNSLKPITFKWKADNSSDIGFGAEDVAQVEPLLVTRNERNEVEGVKYDRITAVLVNAVKEQQQQIEQQESQLRRQQREIDALKRLVVRPRPRAVARGQQR